MTQEHQLTVIGNSVSIDQSTWNDLINEKSIVPLASIVAVAETMVARNGNFMILSGDGSVLRRIDRTSEIAQLVDLVNKHRESKQLDPLV